MRTDIPFFKKNIWLAGAALVMCICTLTGCSGGLPGLPGGASVGTSGTSAEDAEPAVPYDTDLSDAHFLSAPRASRPGVTDAGEDDVPADQAEYTLTYTAVVDHTYLDLIVSDGYGDRGHMIFFELSEQDDGAYFTVRDAYNGGIAENGEETGVHTVQAADDHTYSVEISISGGRAHALINGEDAGDHGVPVFSARSVGVYKPRDYTYAYLDDISLTGSDGITISDDFEGAADPASYGYAGERTGIFAPLHVNIEDDGTGGHRMRAGSGMVLTEVYPDSAPLFRKTFQADTGRISRAYVTATALGSVQIEINGTRVGDEYFAPGRCAFHDELESVTYDITDMVSDENTLDMYLFRGFYMSGNGYPEVASNWGDTPALRACVTVEYDDGEIIRIPTDDSFAVTYDTRYRYSDIYQGEMIDDRYTDLTQAAWSAPETDAVEERYADMPISPKADPGIGVVEELACLSVDEPEPGRYVYDFGRNIAGTVRIDADALRDMAAAPGDVITFRYGEVLNSDRLINSDDVPGTVWTANLFTAAATDYYVFGDGTAAASAGAASDDVADLSFDHTYHGFRYMEVTGLPGPLPAEAVTALALSSARTRTGEFTSSSDIINSLYENARYSVRNNLMSVPTDCAQRDERLGWMGDAQISMPFAAYTYDMKAFYENYLRLARLVQTDAGEYTDLVPTSYPFGGHSCWGDGAVMITWNSYLQYGDRTVIEDNYDAMCAWADCMNAAAEGHILASGGYGDHLSLQGTAEELTDTAWCGHTNRLLAQMARVSGREDDAARFSDEADAYVQAWQDRFLRDDPSVEAGVLYAEYESDTAYSLGLMFDLFPEDIRQMAADRLKLLTEYGGYLFYPGYSGMSFYLPALAEGGYVDDALAVMENTSERGYALPAAIGLTTFQESLGDIRLTDGDGEPYPDGGYTLEGSMDHAAYASVCSFVYTHLLGIRPDPDAPGYDHFYIHPYTGTRLTSASGSYMCRHGLISVAWDTGAGVLSCTVPEGTTCTLILPGGEHELDPGEYTFDF